MSALTGECGWKNFAHCKTCGKWCGWRGDRPTGQALVAYRNGQQKRHDDIWNKQISDLTVKA